MIKFYKTEIKHLIIAILIITFVFAFDDKQPTFTLSYWLTNFFKILIITTITYLIREIAHKIVAARYKAEIEHRIWGIRQILFWTAAKFPIKIKFGPFTFKLNAIPFGIILALVINFISLGKLYFIAVSSFILKEYKPHRLGHRRPNVTNYELGLIALAGPMSNIIFALILNSINSSLFSQAIFINILFAIFYMIPISTLDGSRIFFGSYLLYSFSLAFIILSSIFMYFLTTFQTIILCLIIATLITIIVLIKFHKPI